MKPFIVTLIQEGAPDIELLGVETLQHATDAVRALDRLWELRREPETSVNGQVATSLRYCLRVYGVRTKDMARILDAWEGCEIEARNIQEDRTYMLDSGEEREHDDWFQIYPTGGAR